MATREEIDTEHKTNIQNIQASYHERQEISHEEYHSQLNAESERYKNELIANGYLISPTEPPRSTHLSVLEAVDTGQVKPAKIKRVWEGQDYLYDCFVTESVKDQYVAGDIVVGDYVLVHFDDIGEQIVTAKVFKSW